MSKGNLKYMRTFAEAWSDREIVQGSLAQIPWRSNLALLGKLIAERQNREGWGKSVVERLANDLQNEFPGVGGFSTSNLWCMKGFCEAYTDSPKLAPLVREIGWSHNIVIMERSKDLLEHEFHLAYRDLPKVQPLVAQIGWSHNLNIFKRTSEVCNER